MMFFLLFYNCFIWSSIIRIQLVFIGVGKSIGFLGLNPKRAETGVVPVDEYYKML